MATHLFVRSAYSLLKGSLSIDKLVHEAYNHGFKHVALTDRKVMHGVPEFLKVAQQVGIHPIIGVELDVRIEEEVWPFLFLARTYLGYQKLLEYSSLENTAAQILSLEQLSELNQEVIVLVYTEGGPFEPLLLKENNPAILALAKQLKQSIPSLYLGISHQENAYWRQQNQVLKELLKPLDYEAVACHKVYYGQSHEDELFRVLMAMDKGTTLSDPNLPTLSHRYLLDPQEMEALYTKEECELSDQLAQSCQIEFIKHPTLLPQFETPQGISSQHYLTQLCLQGLLKRLDTNKANETYRNRLKHELDVIFSMHYEDYFLIVWDFIRFAKKQGIYVGPGRGSAAGSLVAYVLGITHVDPLKYGLLFERFLNPDRVSLPDIDTDFPDQRRDEVLAYVLNKYGSDHVAHIATFGTLAAKQVLRDVGKVLELLPRELDSLSKTIPNVPKMTLSLAYQQSKLFKQLIESDERYRKLYAIAIQLEGLPRHISTHAAGIVMSSVPLTQIVPLIQIEADMASTQYTMEHLESLGLIKMDFLGLRNLTIIDDVVQMIKKETQVELNILKIPMDDQATLELIRRVDTVGIFQLESEGMKNLLRQMKASCFEDIVATIALFRPGPMENIPAVIAARQNPKTIQYVHADLKPLLESTYGIMIYQEQIMQVAQKMAGFSLAKADILRKAMSKKNAKELSDLQRDFIQGCIQLKYSEKLATDLFALIQKFANYGFNKSHSVAYAMISYQMAYLKANYAQFFYIALLNSVIGSESKTFEYLQEAKAHRIQLLSPSVNAHPSQYTLENNAIRFPLLIIKGVGAVVGKSILIEQQKGLFTSYHDFVVRMSTHRISKTNFESLIDAGALDEFKLSRASMRASLEDAIDYASMVKVESNQQITIDFNLVKPLPLIEVQDIPLDKAERERLVLGFYLSDHPLTHLKESMNIHQSLSMIQNSTQPQTFICMVKKVKQHRTKTGSMMAFVQVYDETLEIDLVLMPHLFQSLGEQLKVNTILKVEGVFEKESSCLAKRVEVIDV